MFWLGKSSVNKKDTDKYYKLSAIEYVILLHLRHRELRAGNNRKLGQYGYELIEELNKIFSGAWEAKSGTIYPILTKLHKEKGLLRSELKKSPLGPVKKIYTLSEEGRRLIDAIVRVNLEADMQFIKNYQEILNLFKKYFKELELNEPIIEDSELSEQNKEDVENKTKKSIVLEKDQKKIKIYCPLCNAELIGIEKFCHNCGAPLKSTKKSNKIV
ncbi:MAG: helix-turn-helix transcriptional regulator [Promethearchaeota archaeon]